MKHYDYALLGAYIRTERKARGWSLRELAAAADISHTTIDNIERGYDPRTGQEVNITLGTLEHLATALECSAAHLMACLSGTATVALERPLDTWYEDEREDLAREHGGARMYLLLKWGHGKVVFPDEYASPTGETIAKKHLFGTYAPSDEEWQQVKAYAAFLKSKH